MVNHDRGRTRKFLMDFFGDEELANLSFDYFPLVYNEFTTGMPKSQKVRLLVEACQRNGRMPDLLAALERERPNLYHDHFAITPPAPPTTSQPTERNPRQAFISHAHQDADFAHRLAHDLHDHGWQVWMAPDAIRPGEKWVEAINRGLAESGVFVLVLTEAAVSSRWVQSETNVAINMEHRGELNFLPLEVEPVAAPPLWQSYQWISFRDDYKNGLENLLQTLQPDVLAGLSQLYRQLQQAVDRNDWDKAQSLGEKILDQYPDYRETRQLIAQAKEEAKRQELLQKEAAQLYQRLQAAIAAEAWDSASILVAQIQERVKNYRDVAKLGTMVQQKRRQQRWQAWMQQLPDLKRLPAWSWVLLLVPLAVLGLLLWAVGVDGNSGREEPTVTVTASLISLAQTATTGDDNGSNGEQPALTTTASSIVQLQEATATVTPEPIDRATATATTSPSRTPTATTTPSPTPTLDTNVLPSDAEAGETWTRLKDGMVMVYVPPPDEPFVLASGVEAPQEGYWIDKYEVSNAQYQLCVDAGECEPSVLADDERFNGVDYPVVGVSWFDSADYSTWVGGELPTEGEWEYAAVGDSGMKYPWGNDFDGTRLNFCDVNCTLDGKAPDWDDGYEFTAPVGGYPAGDSWVGAANMAGNVREWTASWYSEDEKWRAVRGGSWGYDQDAARAAYRNRQFPSGRYLSHGFRVVVRRPPSA